MALGRHDYIQGRRPLQVCICQIYLPYSAKFWPGKTLANWSFQSFSEGKCWQIYNSYFSESGIRLGKIFPRQNFVLCGSPVYWLTHCWTRWSEISQSAVAQDYGGNRTSWIYAIWLAAEHHLNVSANNITFHCFSNIHNASKKVWLLIIIRLYGSNFKFYSFLKSNNHGWY